MVSMVVPLSVVVLGLDEDVTAAANAAHMPLAVPIEFGEEGAASGGMVHGLVKAVVPFQGN